VLFLQSPATGPGATTSRAPSRASRGSSSMMKRGKKGRRAEAGGRRAVDGGRWAEARSTAGASGVAMEGGA